MHKLRRGPVLGGPLCDFLVDLFRLRGWNLLSSERGDRLERVRVVRRRPVLGNCCGVVHTLRCRDLLNYRGRSRLERLRRLRRGSLFDDDVFIRMHPVRHGLLRIIDRRLGVLGLRSGSILWRFRSFLVRGLWRGHLLFDNRGLVFGVVHELRHGNLLDHPWLGALDELHRLSRGHLLVVSWRFSLDSMR